MAKGNEKNSDGRSLFWAGYGRQVLIAPALTFALLFIFICFFGFDVSILWTNAIVLAIWLVLVWFAFRSRPSGEMWRDYRWIIVPAVLILLFLIDTSWAQSTLSTSSLKKNIVEETSLDSLQLHAEYPSRILYDDIAKSDIQLWITGSSDRAQQIRAKISSSNQALLFAVKPQSDNAPAEWRDTLSLDLAGGANAITLLAQPNTPLGVNSQSAKLILSSGGNDLDTSKWGRLNIESKLASQIRTWEKNFLDSGSLVVSLITAVFVGVKQLEEEKKRQRAERIKQIMNIFDTDVKNDFSKTMKEHLELIADWNEWDKVLQDQFRNKYSSFVEKDLWGVIAGKMPTDITNDIERALQICTKIFEDDEEKPISAIKQLRSSLQQDAHALLSILKKYPASIDVAKQIARSLPDELKRKIPNEYKNEFLPQIIALKEELGVVESDSFPLQRQFGYYARDQILGNKLTQWLNAHQLNVSPFADADSPFYPVLNKELLIGLATPAFVFSSPDFRNSTFGFANSWDAGAALFGYCKALQGNMKIKEEAFFIIVTPSAVEDYGTDRPQKTILHALAEQWIWSLAEAPTLFYSLKDTQRNLLGRLLRWHDFSREITVNKIAERLDENLEEKSSRILLIKIEEWLNGMSSAELGVEEINAFIELRPSSKRRTLFLVSAVDINPHFEKQISTKFCEKLGDKLGWLNAHGCALVYFLVSIGNPEKNSEADIIRQCNERAYLCSNKRIQGFDQLFSPYEGESADRVLAEKANGSPGKMVRLGQKLFLQHVEKYPPDEDLHIEDLLAIE